ncbi:AmmeMemoRadiSam system radical SAM enzyme, partial [Candidatus Bathyarchaeota archaeon]|nr:AmmeMemoRadiSam system radical SAM enzyme [Candidatus Bathyarchaeota archaeon]
GSEGVRYVYVGNVPGEGYEDTVCPNCGQAVIKRIGYTITDWRLTEEHDCTKCGSHIPIVGRREKHTSLF